jgi:hypothetical protein
MATKWRQVKVVGSTLADPVTGDVWSLNPSHNDPVDGTYGPYHWETRDAGAAGGYERYAGQGNVALYNPSGRETVPFWFRPALPHTDGLAEISVDPIDPKEFATVPIADWKPL